MPSGDIRGRALLDTANVRQGLRNIVSDITSETRKIESANQSVASSSKTATETLSKGYKDASRDISGASKQIATDWRIATGIISAETTKSADTVKKSYNDTANTVSKSLEKIKAEGITLGTSISAGSTRGVQGLNLISGAANTTKTSLNTVSQAGRTMGAGVAKGSEVATRSLQNVSKQASSTKSALGEVGTLFAGFAGGFGLAQIGQAMWSGATQREFNKAWLSMKIGVDRANEMVKVINQIVSIAPGDDTFMNSLLTGALAKNTGMSADELKRMAFVAADYLTITTQLGKGQIEAQQDLKEYLLTGETGGLIRGTPISSHVDELKNKKTIQERILALDKALNEEGYKGLSQLQIASVKWETLKGKIQLSATDLGDVILPTLTKIIDTLTWADEISGGWSTKIGIVGAGIVALGIALGPVIWSLKESTGLLDDIGGFFKKKYKMDVDCTPCDTCADGLSGGNGKKKSSSGTSTSSRSKKKKYKKSTSKAGTAITAVAEAAIPVALAITILSSIGTVGGKNESQSMKEFCQKHPNYAGCKGIGSPDPNYSGMVPNVAPPEGLFDKVKWRMQHPLTPTSKEDKEYFQSYGLDVTKKEGGGNPNPSQQSGGFLSHLIDPLGLGDKLKGMNLLDWIFPKGVSASGSGGNQGIMNDIFGPNGLLDYRRFTGGKDIGAWLNDSISKPIQDWWGSWSLGGIAGDIWSKLGLGNIDVGKWFSDNVTTPITDWWNSWTLAGVAGDILSKLGLGNIDVGQWFSDNVTTPITDWWNSWSIGDVTGGIMEKLGLGEDFDITQWCIDNIQTPILNWWNSWSLGGWISKLGFNNLNVNGLIQTYIVQPFLTLSGRITAPLLSTYNTIRSNITNAMNIARTTVQNGVKYVSDRWYWLVGQGRSAWSSVYNAVVPRIQWIGDKINWLRSLVGSGSIKSPGGSFANSTVGGVASAGSGGNSGVFAGAGNFDDIILKGVQSLADKWFGGNVWNIFTMGVGSNPWGAFMNFAERLFSGFHYKFYFNHRQDTLKTHEGNCWDLAEALIAVGKAFGLNGSMHHGFWGSVGHMWTTWSGHGALDPTRWVLDRVWSPPGQHQYGAIGEGYAGYGCNSSLCDPLSTLYGGYSGSSPVTTPAMRVAGLPNVSSISTFSTFVPRPTPRYPVAGGRAVVSGIGYSGTVPQSTQPVQVVRKEFIFHVHGLPEFTRRVQEIIDEEFND